MLSRHQLAWGSGDAPRAPAAGAVPCWPPPCLQSAGRLAVRAGHAWRCREAVGPCLAGHGHTNTAARPAAPTFLLLPVAQLLLWSLCSPPSSDHLRLVVGARKHCFRVLHLPLPAQLLLMNHPISLQQLLGHRLHLLLLHCPDLHHHGGKVLERAPLLLHSLSTRGLPLWHGYAAFLAV